MLIALFLYQRHYKNYAGYKKDKAAYKVKQVTALDTGNHETAGTNQK